MYSRIGGGGTNTSMQSMLMLWGAWGHAPLRKFLKNGCSEIESEGISESNY